MTEANALSISAATPADVPLLLALIRELAEYEKLVDQAVATADGLQQSLFAGAPTAWALIARCAGEPAGFALYFHNFSTFLGRHGLYLEDLFVRPAFRGRGIGKRLLIHLAGLAMQRDCGRLDWAVLDWNTSARQFYEGLGANPMPNWINYRLTGDALRRLADARE